MDNLTTILLCVLGLIMVVSLWKVFAKANEPGWAAIIPIYNIYVLLKIAGKPAWWLILMLIPLVNVVCSIIASIAIAERFGKGPAFGVGLALLGFPFYPLLAFGDATYSPQRPQAKAA